MMSKQEIRKQMGVRCHLMSPFARARRSEELVLRLEQEDWFRQSRIILAYWPLPDEVDISTAVPRWALSRTILLPVMRGEVLDLVPFLGTDALKPSFPYGVMEPRGAVFAEPQSVDLAIVPGKAFDKSGHRMGRGQGYYDRLLAGLPARKIGVGWDFQLLEQIPSETHDISMDRIITF